MGTECEEYAFSKDEVGSDMEDNSNLYATPKNSVSLQRMKFPSPSILISSIYLPHRLFIPCQSTLLGSAIQGYPEGAGVPAWQAVLHFEGLW
jgi:hypothetical protein